MSAARSLGNLGNQNALTVDTANLKVGIVSTSPVGDLQVGAAITMGAASGIISATSYYGDGTNLTNVGVDTATVNTDQLNVIGVATVGSGVTINSTGIEVTSGIITAGTCFKAGGGTWGPGIGATILGSGNVVFAGITSVGSAITMYASSGIVSATAFYGDGSQLEGVSASGGGSSLDITSCLFI